MKQSAANQAVIKIENLVKKFGKFTALDQLNLTVNRGEVHGFLGPNGSGKSTTIRILLGLLRKTGGQVSLLDQDPWQESVALHRHLSYVPGDVSLWPNLSGGEVIDLFTDLRGGSNRKRRAELLEQFQLDPTKKCRTYSKGNRQKVALVAALACDTELYILDEPTSGLDPLMESVFQDYIKQLKKANKTILLSSHILAEVESLADKVTIIREGKTVESGSLAQLRHLSRHAITVKTKQKISGLAQLPGIYDLKTTPKSANFQVDHDKLGSTITHLAKFEIETLTSEPPSLEELFMRHYDTETETT